MSFDLTSYLPNSLTAVFATVATWVFRDHVGRDDSRFTSVSGMLKDLSEKLDASIKTQSDNHAEILKILLRQSNDD